MLAGGFFNSAEKRLARALLLLTRFGKEDRLEPVLPKMSHEALAEIVGTTRARVSFFMNRFRKLGFIDSTEAWKFAALCWTSCCTTEATRSGEQR